MGFLDKLKGAVNAVTGGAAEVTIDIGTNVVSVGDTIEVRVTCKSKGSEVKSKGVFVDIQGEEVITYRDESNKEKSQSKVTFTQEIQIAPALVLAPNDGKEFRGQITIPANLLHSYQGQLARHTVAIRGRLEAFGNDPDSGYKPITVHSKR